MKFLVRFCAENMRHFMAEIGDGYIIGKNSYKMAGIRLAIIFRQRKEGKILLPENSNSSDGSSS